MEKELLEKNVHEFTISEKPNTKNRCYEYNIYADGMYLKKYSLKRNDFMKGIVENFEKA